MSKKDFEDDGRTIADMSFLDDSHFRIRIGGRKKEEKIKADPLMSSDERRAYIKGVMSASFLIGGIFIGGLALVILILFLVL